MAVIIYHKKKLKKKRYQRNMHSHYVNCILFIVLHSKNAYSISMYDDCCCLLAAVEIGFFGFRIRNTHSQHNGKANTRGGVTDVAAVVATVWNNHNSIFLYSFIHSFIHIRNNVILDELMHSINSHKVKEFLYTG